MTVRAELAALIYMGDWWTLLVRSVTWGAGWQLPKPVLLSCFPSCSHKFQCLCFLNMRLHRFSGVYDRRDTLPLECMDQSRHWGLERSIASGFVLLNELCGQVRTAIFMLLWEQILLKSSNLTASPVSLFSQIQTALLVLEAVPDACLSAEEIKHLFQQYKSIWERDIPSTRRLVCTAGSEMTATAACSLSYWAKVSSSIWLK